MHTDVDGDHCLVAARLLAVQRIYKLSGEVCLWGMSETQTSRQYRSMQHVDPALNLHALAYRLERSWMQTHGNGGQMNAQCGCSKAASMTDSQRSRLSIWLACLTTAKSPARSRRKYSEFGLYEVEVSVPSVTRM